MTDYRSTNVRTIVSAINPVRKDGDYVVMLKVWFEELPGPVPFAASPFDCEYHGKELWIRAMAGEYGPVEVVQNNPRLVSPIRMLEHGRQR